MKCSTAASAPGNGRQDTALRQINEKIPKPQRRARNSVSGRTALCKTRLLGIGQNHFLNINFRVDFVKPFIFTLLEIASFGLFYKSSFETMQNGWFSRQIMVFIKVFNRAALSLSAVASKEFQMLRWAFQRVENSFVVYCERCKLPRNSRSDVNLAYV